MKIRHRVETAGSAPPVCAAIGTGAATYFACAMLGPLGLLLAPAVYALTSAAGREGFGGELDEVLSDCPDEAFQTWLHHLRPGEKVFNYEAEVGSNGAMFNLPIIRRHTFEIIDEEEW